MCSSINDIVGPSVSLQVILLEDEKIAPNGNDQIPTRRGGCQVSGHVEVLTHSIFEFCVDVAFEGKWFKGCVCRISLLEKSLNILIGLIRTWIGERNDYPLKNDVQSTAEFKVERLMSSRWQNRRTKEESSF